MQNENVGILITGSHDENLRMAVVENSTKCSPLKCCLTAMEKGKGAEGLL